MSWQLLCLVSRGKDQSNLLRMCSGRSILSAKLQVVLQVLLTVHLCHELTWEKYYIFIVGNTRAQRLFHSLSPTPVSFNSEPNINIDPLHTQYTYTQSISYGLYIINFIKIEVVFWVGECETRGEEDELDFLLSNILFGLFYSRVEYRVQWDLTPFPVHNSLCDPVCD